MPKQILTLGVGTSLFLAVIIVLPITTPRQFRNSATYAFGHFENGGFSLMRFAIF